MFHSVSVSFFFTTVLALTGTAAIAESGEQTSSKAQIDPIREYQSKSMSLVPESSLRDEILDALAETERSGYLPDRSDADELPSRAEKAREVRREGRENLRACIDGGTNIGCVGAVTAVGSFVAPVTAGGGAVLGAIVGGVACCAAEILKKDLQKSLSTEKQIEKARQRIAEEARRKEEERRRGEMRRRVRQARNQHKQGYLTAGEPTRQRYSNLPN